MSSPMLTGLVVPTGTSLVQSGCPDTCSSVHEKDETDFHLLQIKWAVVADARGNFQGQMQWVVTR
jgi:hypothetical protein